MERTYQAIFYRQRTDAPIQVAFVAPSSEIAAWSRVPTKKTANIRNFQRAQIPGHVSEVSKFFGDRQNSSPTAVVVGFDPIRSHGSVRLTTPDGAPFDDTTVQPGESLDGRFHIAWPDASDPETVAEFVELIERHRERLAQIVFAELVEVTKLDDSAIRALAAGVQRIVEKGTTNTLDLEDDEEDDDSADVAVADLPPDLLAYLSGRSPSERQVAVGRLVLLAQAQSPDLERLSLDELKALATEVAEEVKPGLLIDGQHRVHGTKKLGRIPFLVTALPHAAWPELAFQFIVTNRTARRVPESLLISIVGNSLSREQRASIEERLRAAGIRVGLIEAVMRVHEDESSPFFGMLAFGVDNENGFIDAAAMRGKVIHPWFERKRPIEQLFDHFCEGRKKHERTEFWKDEELWFTFFIQFWSAAVARYEGTAVFSTELDSEGKPVSKMMAATVLKIFQDTVLSYLDKYLRDKNSTEGVPLSESLPSAERLAELVKNALAPLTPDFFVGWKLTGFDGSIGARDDLANAIKTVLNRDKTVAQLKTGKYAHRLFLRPSDAQANR